MNGALLQARPYEWGIVGHDYAIDLLRRALTAQRVRHAYLFTGPEYIGKTLLAHRFAQTLLCTSGPDPRIAPLNPCGTCLACRKVMHGNHPDVHFISRAPDKQFIVIEQVRVLQNDSARRTLEGRRNIFIIQGMHEMNIQAANCLLKTLWKVEPREANVIAALAAGRMGWAVQAVEDENLLAERKEQLETLTKLLAATRVERFAAAQRLSEDTGKLSAILELWLLWWRDIVLAARDSLDLIVNVDMRSIIAKQATQVGPTEAERMVRAILRTMEALEQNVNARVALEVLMLDMPMVK